MIDSILIILVTYNTKIDESPAFISLTSLLNENSQPVIFIYDNSFEAQRMPLLAHGKIIYQHDPINPGVSKAYNQGFKNAKVLGKKWMLLSDQDTYFPAGFFDQLSESIRRYPNNELFVPQIRTESLLISPFKFRWGRGVVLKSFAHELCPLHDFNFINSGLVVSVALFEKCNGYDERFPLDFSDLAFARRAASYVKEFVVTSAICGHELSSDEISLTRSLHRFRYFVTASVLYGTFYDRSFFLFVNRLARAIKLSILFKSLEFLKLLIMKQ